MVKLSGLTLKTKPGLNSLLEIKDDPSGSPVSKSATLDALASVPHSYGGVICSNNTTPLSLSASANTHVTSFTGTLPLGGSLTLDGATGIITTSVAGTWDVSYNLCFKGQTNGLYKFFLGNAGATPYAGTTVERSVGDGAATYSVSLTGILQIATSSEIRLWVNPDTAGNFTLRYAAIRLVRLGPQTFPS